MNTLIRKLVIWFSVVIGLGGCYETEMPILERGEKASISGEFECHNRISGGEKIHSFNEVKEGVLLANYRYVEADETINLLKRLSSGLYLVQSSRTNQKFEYVYVDFLDKNIYLVLIADLMGKQDYIESLLRKYRVYGKKTDAALLLSGDRSSVYDFMAAHDKSLLTVWLKCERIERLGSNRSGYELRVDGLGPVKIGMHTEEAAKMLGVPLRRSPDDAASAECHFVYPKGNNNDTGFMVEGNHITRIDIGAEGIPSTGGIRVGDAESDVRRAFGGTVKEEQHPYEEEGKYLTVEVKPGYSFVFETNRGRITRFRAGQSSSVVYVEGCS